MSEDCKDVIPIKTWIEQSTEKTCRPCTLPILIQWYQSELNERGYGKLGDTLKNLIKKEEVSPEEIAEELDNIKAKTEDRSLKERLKEFDCAIQRNEPDI